MKILLNAMITGRVRTVVHRLHAFNWSMNLQPEERDVIPKDETMDRPTIIVCVVIVTTRSRMQLPSGAGRVHEELLV